MELYAGLDLHSRNTYIGIMDETFNRVFKKRVSNDLDQILQTVKPFKKRLKGFVVESTYNWYWLVDGLMDAGYPSAPSRILCLLIGGIIKPRGWFSSIDLSKSFFDHFKINILSVNVNDAKGAIISVCTIWDDIDILVQDHTDKVFRGCLAERLSGFMFLL